ncbi:MAG: glycosyltransferase family 39 protein [bacterium]|nr:glycosyltransferase family 39 protein [bacterium]
MRLSRIEWMLIGFIFTVKLLLVFVVVFAVGQNGFLWSADGPEYIDLGRNLIEGRGFGRTVGGEVVLATDRVPLYPLLVALLMGSVGFVSAIPVALFQAFLAAGIALFTYRIACRFVSERWALLPALLVSFEPVISALHLFVFAETLLVFFVTLFVYLFLEYFDTESGIMFFGSLLALSAAVYTKPVAIYLIIIPLVYLIFRNWRYGVVAILMLGAILSPWVIRNYYVSGVASFNTYGSKTPCGYAITGILAARDGFPDASPGAAITRVINTPEYWDLRIECETESVSRVFGRLLRDNPASFIKANFFTALAFFTNDGFSSTLQKEDSKLPPHHNYLSATIFLGTEWLEQSTRALGELTPVEFMAVLLAKLFWLGIFVLMLIGIWRVGLSKKGFFILLVLLYFGAASIVGGGIGTGARFRYHVAPLIFIFATYALEYIYSKSIQT